MIPFISNIQKRKMYRDRKQFSGFLEFRVGMKIDWNGHTDGNFLKLDYADGYITITSQKIVEFYTYNWWILSYVIYVSIMMLKI